MPALDTNVLVRLLAGDDPEQARLARDAIARAERNSDPLFVSLTVVLELEWVLRASYRYSKEQVLATVSALLEARELEFQEEPSVERALHYYRESGADFAECMHLGCAATAARIPLWTFDRRAARLPDARALRSDG